MNDIQGWAPTFFAGVTVIGAAAAYLMDFGGFRQKARDAANDASDAHKKLDALSRDFNDYKVQAAKDFATIPSLAAAELRFAAAVDGIRTDFRAVAERFDKMLIEMARAGKDI